MMREILLLVPFLLAAQPAEEKGRHLLEAIHNGDVRAVRSALKSGASAGSRDELGSTALMHAAAYGSVECMRALIEGGADVNASSNDGFTALMWAASEPAKLRFLLSRGANVQARSKDGNTALILARQNGFADSIRVLLDARAADEDGMTVAGKAAIAVPRDVLLQVRSIGIEPMHLEAGRNPMFIALWVSGSSSDALRAMLDAGVDPNTSVRIVTLELPALAFAAHYRNLDQVRVLLERGANPNAHGSGGVTPLMAAAAAQWQDPAVIDALLAKGASVNARDESGRSALDWALLQGETATARKLRAAGAPASPATASPSPVTNPRSPHDAVHKAVELLLPAGPAFFKQSGGCISCHHNSLPALAARLALNRKVAVDPGLAAHHAKAAMATWRPMQEKMAVGASSIPGLIANLSYEMIALAEEGFRRDFVTDAAALALLRLQRSNGGWALADPRPPLGDVLWTALCVRALQVYAPPALLPQRDAAIRRAIGYLREVEPRGTQDEAFTLLGLRWASASEAAVMSLRTRLLASQRDDGGWAQLPTMRSDAYATGEALYALSTAGVKPSAPAYRRGVAYLLKTQLPDGSWFVPTRGLAFQPYQETGFSHGKSQFISAAATSWAVIALTAAID
jgi:ankyrin repeat protein